MHIICWGHYLPIGPLSKQWLQCTRDSQVVDVRKIWDPQTAANYVAKYLAKAVNQKIASNPSLFDELVNATHNQRAVIKFGKMPDPVDKRKDDDYPADWQPVCSLNKALAEANSGSTYHQQLLQSLTETDDEPLHADLQNKSPPEMSDLHE